MDAASAFQPEPPEPPTATGDAADPSSSPTYTETDSTPEPAAQSSSPAPGSTRGDNAVCNPVFGWIVPSQIEQIPVDSNGDINKMAGNMRLMSAAAEAETIAAMINFSGFFIIFSSLEYLFMQNR